ncbi:putative MFS family arabinose efflux permease [Novosphingobium chloroacetimidivorans]|uniref:Putative MFS family arabinose efflux permease n=1 Tax=Novosphingobium chloroacetimidivorans TaxID=1428314 RepID=A0A7W7K9Z5_9SPHN|nr:MFS transporter [Novosphingobium chloroacetimidivorans]MBB4858959.1 putative MFS family arabinose efflux permease [Novosphingobium chloroacetimidivorans]
MAVGNQGARREFGEHWRMMAAASIGFSFTAVITASTGLFIEPLSREFGWSRTLVSSGVSITAVLTFLGSPLFGVFIDKWGTRRMAIPGLILMAGVIASLSLLTGSRIQWFAIWTLYALAALATKSTVWTAAVNSTFDAGRGLALGVVLSGSALAQGIVPPLTNYLIDAFGWRGAYVWLGLGWGALAVLLSVVWLRDGYDISRRKRMAEPACSASASLLDVPGLSVSEAWRNPDLWRIAISTFVIMTATVALIVHQIPILEEVGVGRTTAAFYAGLAGLVGILGKLVTGVLLDRYPARWVGGITIAATSMTYVLLLWPGAPTAVIVLAMMINGYAGGTKLQLVGYLTAAYTGMRKFGTIFGAMASLIAAGSGLGPVLGGWIHDTWGSYEVLLWGGFGITLLSSLLLFGLRAYPSWSGEAGSPGAG